MQTLLKMKLVNFIKKKFRTFASIAKQNVFAQNVQLMVIFLLR